MARGSVARDGKKESMWRRHVQAQAQGGMTVRAYCAVHRLQEYSFYWWRRELARRDVTKPGAFVPVTVATEVPGPAPGGQVEIVLPGDRRVLVTGPVDRLVTGRVKTSQCGGGQNQPVNMLPVYFM